MKERLVGLRGKEYFAELTAIFAEVGDTLVAELKETKTTTGNFTVGDLVLLADRHELPFKGTCEYLEKRNVIKCGSYDVMVLNGLNLRKLREQLAGRVDEGWSTEADGD